MNSNLLISMINKKEKCETKKERNSWKILYNEYFNEHRHVLLREASATSYVRNETPVLFFNARKFSVLSCRFEFLTS